jgi:hypothetical protein
LKEFSSNPTIVPVIFVPSFRRSSSASETAAANAIAARISAARFIPWSMASVCDPGKPRRFLRVFIATD